MTRDLGFIGVGAMATPMVWRFIERGWKVHLVDPVPARTAEFRDHCQVVIQEDVAALASTTTYTLLSLPTPRALSEVSARLASVRTRSPAIVINTSTTGAAATREAADRLAAAGSAFVDAPVSGGVVGAREGSLTVLVSGADEPVRACEPVFEVIGRQILRIGSEAGQAQVMKVANNVLSLGALAATAEATALARRAGIPMDIAISALDAGSGRNSATSVKFPRHVLSGNFDFGFPAEGALKDVSLFTALAAELGVETPLAQAVVDCWRLAVESGYGAQDCTRIVTMYERMAGLADEDEQ
ncbi:NAD(P)-dependent oxidoreductase [Nocardia sp. NBC_01329]|uniref:NAD(P)-dependent oxidoreductase n=1 Tax=Nocardia sp. NBC_01329 TaxID=2903594 RepID=UPI002E12F0D2|nr:NAD(P)-dependent oxidoreductase [Nocardia sp. NBC_01329]